MTLISKKTENDRHLKKWLIDNKIYFETIAAALLALMALIVAIQANKITKYQTDLVVKQTELIELQTNIELQQVLPQFVIQAIQIMNPSTGYAEDDELSIKNVGGLVKELHSKTAIFLNVELYYEDPRKGDPINKSIPINGYYAATEYNAQGQGQVLTLVGYKNNKCASDLKKIFTEFAKNNEMYGFLNLDRYLRLNYKDMLGKSHIAYFHVPLIYGARSLDPSEGEVRFNEHNDAVRNNTLLSFDDLTPEIIFNAVK